VINALHSPSVSAMEVWSNSLTNIAIQRQFATQATGSPKCVLTPQTIVVKCKKVTTSSLPIQ
jgi:hypothetical protein